MAGWDGVGACPAVAFALQVICSPELRGAARSCAALTNGVEVEILGATATSGELHPTLGSQLIGARMRFPFRFQFVAIVSRRTTLVYLFFDFVSCVLKKSKRIYSLEFTKRDNLDRV